MQYLLGAASIAKRRGMATHDQAPGTLGRNCEPLQDVELTRRVLYCPKGDWVTMKYTVPLRIVSGSEVLWAVSVRLYAIATCTLFVAQPISWSTMREETLGTSNYNRENTELFSVIPSHMRKALSEGIEIFGL